MDMEKLMGGTWSEGRFFFFLLKCFDSGSSPIWSFIIIAAWVYILASAPKRVGHLHLCGWDRIVWPTLGASRPHAQFNVSFWSWICLLFFPVQVWIRGATWIRGFCIGYIAAFDKQWNLAMTDVDETFTRRRHRKTPILGNVSFTLLFRFKKEKNCHFLRAWSNKFPVKRKRPSTLLVDVLARETLPHTYLVLATTHYVILSYSPRPWLTEIRARQLTFNRQPLSLSLSLSVTHSPSQ
jgi:hypothetical protein